MKKKHNKESQIMVRICFFVVFIFFSAHALFAETISLDSLWNTYASALETYKKKKDANKAVEMLEKAGVRQILTETPAGWPKEKYATLLNDYGFLLYKTDNRLQETINVLQRVIVIDPERALAYRNLSDVYQKLFKTDGNPKNKEEMKKFYEEYLKRIAKDESGKKNTDSIGALRAGPKFCEFMAEAMRRDNYNTILKLFNPEREVSVAKLSVEELALKGFLFEDPTEYEGNRSSGTRLYTIDIDNDDIDELRFETVAGTLYCMDNVFYNKNKEGKYVSLNDLSKIYSEGCLNSLNFIRYGGNNYFIYNDGNGKNLSIHAAVDGKDHFICNLNSGLGQPKIFRTCNDSICIVLEKWLSTRLPGLYQKWNSPENIDTFTFFQGKKGDLELDAEQQNPASAAYVYNYAKYIAAIDIDNDGIFERISKNWEQKGTCCYKAFIIEFEKKDNIFEEKFFSEIKPIQEWSGFSQIGLDSHMSDIRDVFFMQAKGKVYWVVLRGYTERKQLDIYIIEKQNVKSIGTIFLYALQEVAIEYPEKKK